MKADFGRFSEEKSSFSEGKLAFLGLFQTHFPLSHSDTECMKSFADVLQERLEKKIRDEFRAQSSSENKDEQPSPLSQWMTTDPAFLSQVMAQTPKFHFKKPAPRKAHRLPETLIKSYQFMLSLGLDLHPGFTLNELKAAFRQGAKKTHPDHGGQGEDFRRLKDEYQRLVQFLTVKA